MSNLPVIGLPSGAGDCSWAYSKLKHVGPLRYEIADGWPYRTKPYFALLPECISAEYGPFTYPEIVNFQACHGINGGTKWSDLANRGWGQILLEPNHHLEMGKPLADWLPDLPTDYHYPMVTTELDQQKARDKLFGLRRPLWGISAASYRGAEAWKTWGEEKWLTFLRAFHAEVGGTIILMGGSWDDLTDSLAPEVGRLNASAYPLKRLAMRFGWKSKPMTLVGKTSMGTAVEILKHLDGYLGFSSGLGVLQTVLYGKAFLMWPEHQVELSTSWADPSMLDGGQYQASLWRDPLEVMQRVRNWLKLPDCPERKAIQK